VACVVERLRDGGRTRSVKREPEEHLDHRLAFTIDDQAPADSAVLAHLDERPVPVRPVADVVAPFDRTATAGGDCQATTARVLVVPLPGHDRIQQVTKRVGILHGADPDLALQCPQGDLDSVPRGPTVTSRQAVGVLRPQLRLPPGARDLLGATHCRRKTGTSITTECGERLVDVFRDYSPVRIARDHTPALAKLIR
jgi:hypothetical protein